jgi:hypothetical protein
VEKIPFAKESRSDDMAQYFIKNKSIYKSLVGLYTFYCSFDIKLPTFFFRGKGIFREKPSIPEYTGFEIGKTGIIPVSVLRFQYRIGNTSGGSCNPSYWASGVVSHRVVRN